METGEGVEICIKTEIVDSDSGETSNVTHNDPRADLKLREEEIWIKPDITEESEDSIKQEIHNEIEIEIPPNTDGSAPDNDGELQGTVLPLKKRKQLVDDNGSNSTDTQNPSELPKSEGGEKSSDDATKNSEQTGKEDEAPKEKYIMYSYEVTKNIQIVTITEEERQLEHIESVNARRHMRHVCEDCAIGFVLKQAYLMHMKVHSKEAGEHECDLCHSHLKSADMLYRHKLRHYRRYRCLLCWTRFKDKDTAACHVMNDHVGTNFECDQCGRGFKRPQYLKRHVEQHHTKPHRLECTVCLRVFHEKGWYRSHIRTHNEEIRASTVRLPITCEICSRSFKSKMSLKRHLETHDPNKMTCDICEVQFKNRTTLGQHYWDVHHEKCEGVAAETCGVCLRVCATRAMLRRHQRRMHSDRTKKYQCDHCQRYYLTKGEVRSHISWSHMPRESAARVHACVCGRVFRTPSLLRDHTARFHELRPPPRIHECDLCGKAFANKQVLTRHKKSHSNEMYPCNECGLLFKTQPYVKVHYQLKHLNMTRAEINAQRKLNKQNRIAQNNIHIRSDFEPPIRPKKMKKGDEVNDPLMVGENEVQIKLERNDEEEEDLQVPLFQTFVDVAHQ